VTLPPARRRKTSAAIFTASMADVVFLLIVFFILTYSVSSDLTQVELPKTRIRTDVPRDAALISIASPDDREVIRVSTGQEIAMLVSSDDEILTFASTVVAADPEREFVIKADHGVSYERVDTVLDALKQARATTIYLLSEAESLQAR
jgi:biopolymer transport protein ExbD